MENAGKPNQVLLVDDDPVALRIYRDGLARLGFEVKTAGDGLAALQVLRADKPDVVILDLMMPRFYGVEVLKFIRGEKTLAGLSVIVLSNAYMDQMAQDAAALGAQKGLLKLKCNPASLAAAIKEVLSGQTASQSQDHLLAASKLESAPASPPGPPPPITPAPPAPRPMAAPPSPPAPKLNEPHTDAQEQARRELCGNAHAIAHSIRQLLDAFHSARGEKDKSLRLQDLSRKVHFITAMAGIAEYHGMAQMASAFEALLFSLMDKLPHVDPSAERTTSAAVEFLAELLTMPPEARPDSPAHPLVLVVDDDRLSNRLVITALRGAQLQARGTESPEIALQWLREKHYDLVLLDIEMPGIDGIELCKRLRLAPGYEKTPVIYVTLHSDFETHARVVTSGGNDLIAKPILPTELAVKAVMHLLKAHEARKA